MKIMLLDGNSLINRAFFGIPLLTAPDGEYTNAVYGFLNIMFKLVDEEKPDCMERGRQSEAGRKSGSKGPRTDGGSSA